MIKQNPIKILDTNVVSKIAAGEVVERPASVVKELLENSLDAGASQVSIETKSGGLNTIQVTDNGTGISSDEAELAFSRYATSKINDFKDLESISSFGFRGEALPSIAAVAQVDIVTRSEDENIGSRVTAGDGVVTKHKSEGRSSGTTVTVRNLFRKVPARLKFLKSTTTENSHIANIASHYAMAFPEVRFTLFIDGRAALRTSGSGRLLDTIIQVHGLEMAQHMLALSDNEKEWASAEAEIVVTGRISSASVTRSNRNYLSFFVNRRWISSRLLSWAVEEAYHGLLMTGKHPIAVINISISPREIDINIHPTKTEVKFRNEHQVFVAVQKAVRRALIEQAPVPKIEEVATPYASPSTSRQPMWTLPGTSVIATTAQPVMPQVPQPTLPVLRAFGQMNNSYIIAEGPDGLYLIDQHAAHERIIYEKIKYRQSEVEVQGLLEPATFEVDPKQEEVLRSHYQELAEFGFSIEPFGDRTYLVRALPALLHNKDWAMMLGELLDSLTGESRGDWMEKLAISMACHGAVRAGQALTSDEMRELIRQLEQVDVPMTCPHGRPTMIRLSSEQLAREFGR